MSFGQQSNAWQQQRGMMQGHPSANSFHQQGPQQMFMQTPQQNNMATSFHGGGGGGGPGGMYPNSGGGTVAYPINRGIPDQPRNAGLNPAAFGQGGGGSGIQPQQTHYNSIGTVTKINTDCGLVNNEVFFYRNVCKGPEPKLGDRVIFEAAYSSSGQFKWNATRVQLLTPNPQAMNSSKGNYGSVTPSNEYQRAQMQRHPSPKRVMSPIRGTSALRHERERRERERERERHHRSRDRDDDEHERKRRREDNERSRDRNTSSNRGGAASFIAARADRERDREPLRRERELPERDREREQREREREREREKEREKPREVETHRAVVPKGAAARRARAIRRYTVQIPKSLLPHKTADVQEIRNRYTTLYIPSDFFHAKIKWTDAFTPDNPFSLRRPCKFYIMPKQAEPPFEQKSDDLEPADVDYVYSAKVMLMALPTLAEIYKKSFESTDDEIEQPTHTSRLINFLVGIRGRNEPTAIGGPWSPSLDGANPDTDPSVLIRTAIRTCKALTGIDLSNCTQWYRFVELYYHRTEYKNMEKGAPPRVETVVVYLPDIHSCMPSIKEYETMSKLYKTTADNIIARKTAAHNTADAAAVSSSTNEDNNNESTNADEGNNETAAGETDQNEDDENAADEAAAAAEGEDDDNADASVEQEDDENNADEAEENDNDDAEDEQMDNSGVAPEADEDMGQDAENTNDAADENEEEEPTPEPTHYSLLDLKSMKVQEIRDELLARDLSDKGVRNVVVARLAKALSIEKAEELKAKNREHLKKKKLAAKNVKAAAKKEDSKGKKKDVKNEDNDESKEDWTEGIDFELSDIVILDEYDASKNPEDKNIIKKKSRRGALRRYTLPTSPHLVVHPNKLAKGGDFDCAVMSLAVLLDYHPEDTKERFFEVSLFAELFNEMLMRDFAFNIYKEIHIHNEQNAEENVENAEVKTEGEQTDEANGGDKSTKVVKEEKSDEPPSKVRKRETVAENGADKKTTSEDKKAATSGKPQRRMSTVDGRETDAPSSNETGKKMVVVKPQLLLSFLYFDTTHCGYIFERDLEDLFSVIGLNLSRSQIKKTLGKLASRQSIHYRKLTDKEESAEGTPCIEDADDLPSVELRDIASGNNKYEFVFGDTIPTNCVMPIEGEDSNDADLINYNGTVVHVGKLMDQIKRTEKSNADLEKLYNDLKSQHFDLQKEHSRSSSKLKTLNSDVKSLTRKLSDTNQDLYSLNRKYRDQNSTLSYIYTRVQPYFVREKDKEKEKDSKSETSHKDKDDKKKEEEKSKDSKDNKETEKDKNVEKDNEKSKDKPKEKSNDKDNKAKETEKEKDTTKEKDNKEKPKSAEKEKEATKEKDNQSKSKEADKEKESAKEKDDKDKSENEKKEVKETTKKSDEKDVKKEVKETPKKSDEKDVKKDTPKKSDDKDVKKEVKETPKKSDEKDAKETPKKEEEKVTAKKTEDSESLTETEKVKESPKPTQTTTTTVSKTATTKPTTAKSTPAKASAAKATPAKATPAKGAAAKATPAKATPAKATPAKKQGANVAKKAAATENAQK